MTRRFTIELNDAEAATVWRMAELTGIPAALILRRLHRGRELRSALLVSQEETAGQTSSCLLRLALANGDTLSGPLQGFDRA